MTQVNSTNLHSIKKGKLHKKSNKRRSLTLPMTSNNEVLKEAAVRIGMGKLVAPGTTLENRVPRPTLDTP